MTNHRCPRHPNRMAAPGLMVCSGDDDRPGCVQQLGASLDYLASMWDELAWEHLASHGGFGHQSHGSRPPCSLDVIEAMDASGGTHGETPIAHVVAEWCRVVVEDRRLVAPSHDTGQRARWLGTQVGWLCGQDFADEAINELRDAARALAGLLGDSRQGQCTSCPTEGCTGTLVVDMAQARRGMGESEPDTVCRTCGRGTSPSMLLRMARVGDVDGWLDAAAIEAVLGVSRSTLDRWARSGRISREHGRYLLAEVVRAKDVA